MPVTLALLPRRWDPLKRTSVPDPIGIVDDHHVALRDEETARVLDTKAAR
jgi:hypothetical protein